MFSKCRFVYVLLLPIVSICYSQTIRINEMASSNSVYFDEDGDTPDWIELHNYGSANVSIDGWGLSDDPTDLFKWTFPNINLASNEYLLIWASSKDRSQVSYSRTLINHGDVYKYLIPNAEPDSNWKSVNYNDAVWAEGPSGFGYADGDDATIIPSGSLSVFLRKNFTITDLDQLTSLILDIDYDDAFVAYINGVEIARANINGVPPAYNSGTIQDHEAQMYSGNTPDRFIVNNPLAILNEGENILSIQGHNISANSSDFTLIPFLSAVFSSPSSVGISPPEILNLTSENLHTNFKISSDIETVTLTHSSGDIIDQVTAEALPPDTSVGVSVFNSSLVNYTETTPGYPNSNIEFLGAITSTVQFSSDGGLMSSPVNLSMSGNTWGQVIRYTLDTSIPTASSPIYFSPITVGENTVVRARIFASNYIPSPTFSRSFVFNQSHELDVVFLTTDSDNLFDENSGIYVFGPDNTYDPWEPYFGANFWEDWERPVHFAFYENGSSTLGADFNAGIKIFGGWSRGQNNQRSLSLFARGKYGDSKFEHPFFNQLSYSDFDALVLRNSGQDWLRSNMKDMTLTSLMRGSGLDFQEHNPVATYLNGEYWGMYNMREKNNEEMLSSKHGFDADELTILQSNAEIVEGDNVEYNALVSYVQNTDLSSNLNFSYVEQRIDLVNYALYQAANIFFNNTDWPGNNIKFWKSPSSKWRWVMYDTDFGFGPWWATNNYYNNTLNFALDPDCGCGWPNPSWSTLLFRRMVTNINFRNQFINRYADELNTRFLPEQVKSHIDNIRATIQSEIPAHYQRWGVDPSQMDYYVEVMKEFAEFRPNFAKDHIKNQFDLPNFHAISILNYNIEEGFVRVNNNLKIQQDSWTGDYFETVPITLKAVPEAGYEFSHWGGGYNATETTITIDLTEANYIIPYFSPAVANQAIVINEINYKSSEDFNPDDWVELYNPNSATVDVSNWQLKDDDDSNSFVIPEGTSIPGESYLILVKDASNFSAVFPDITNYVGDLGFGLGSTADAVRLYNDEGLLQDEVYYTSDAPWPVCANGTGYSLELTSPNLDNSVAQSWDCINEYGSPNAVNNNSLGVVNNMQISPVIVYPNPAQNTLYIATDLNPSKLEIYNLTGQLVVKQSFAKEIDISAFQSGLYVLKLNIGKDKKVFKFLKQ